MRLLITGASGFIGSHLVSVASKQGWDIVSFSRSGIKPEGASKAFAWSFGQKVPINAFEGVNYAIHLAHDFSGEKGAKETIISTYEMALLLNSSGVQRQIFVSSYSAGNHSSSLYGKTKFQLEKFLSKLPNITIVRPGLVMGGGGLYGRICHWSKVLPIIPLPDGGKGMIPVIEVGKLCVLLLEILRQQSPPLEANLFESELISLRQLIIEFSAKGGKHPLIVPIPSNFLMFVLKITSFFHIRLPINEDNLKGFIKNQTANHTRTQL